MNYTNKILIIDDSESSATYLMGLLSDCNYKVMCVHNGKDALKKARSQQFDLILLDFVMPDMNGLDVCRALKKIPSIKDVPVVFLTANHSEELLIQAFNAGAVDFVTKPYNVSELMARVKTQLSLVESKKQLAIAKDYAESANKAKGEFLANMSHEIRTPMNGIIAVADFLEETQLTKKQKEFTEIIKTSSENLLAIINDILDFSKIEAGQLILEDISFNLKQEIRKTLKPLALKTMDKGVILNISFEEDIPEYLVGDVLRIKQIVINLVNNAIKFTESGSIDVYVGVKLKQKNKISISFSVKDTGIGISKENLKKLFNSFTQADASSTRKYGGTGLGLAISKNLVGLMGGEISVESVLGEGSVFSFYIPFDITKKSGVKHEKEIAEVHKPKSKIWNILIVDDNAINRKVAQMTLKRLGHQTDMAVNGIDAYHKYLDNSYDMILMDVHMPEMDGLETTRLIRKYERQNKVANVMPIIAMTAAAMKGDRERFLESGMDDYVSKPFKVVDIELVLEKYV